jgi:DNA-binding response OmpR family regulator
MTARILVVDDDPLVCKGLKFHLEQAGYQVLTAGSTAAALLSAARGPLDLALLDIGLPDRDGLNLCRELKERYSLPVIFLTARRRELDEIVGLEVGGDDYITKPFGADLVLAHVKAVLRRQASGASGGSEEAQPLAIGPFQILPASHRVLVSGKEVHLAPREFDLLQVFMSNPDRVFTADELIEAVWGVEFIGEPQVLYVQMHSLRAKLEPAPEHPRYLLTLRGVGYKFLP